MEAKLEKIENNEAYLEIEVDAEKLEEGLEKAYKKVVKQVSIPGFRKGRVPRELLERHFGSEVLYEDALEAVVPDAYELALKKIDVEPIAQPEFDIVEIEAGKGLKFTAKVAVKPEVKLGEIEGLELKIPKFEVKEEDIEKKLDEMRSSYAEIVEKEENAELGDTVTIDFEGFVDDVAFEGGKGEDYQLELGSNTFIPGFEEQLVGTKKGEEKDVNVNFPEEYQSEDLAGKPAFFKVLIKKVESKKERVLDDDFVQEVSELDTVEELKADIKEELIKTNEKQKNAFLKDQAIAKLEEASEIIIAPAVVEAQLQTMMQQFEQRMVSQGLSFEQYLQFTNSTLESFKEQMKPEAERNAKINFILEKLVEEKGFELSDEELDQQLGEIAQSMGVELEQAKQNLAGMMDQIEYNIKVDKAIQYLVDNAKIIEDEENSEEEQLSAGEIDE